MDATVESLFSFRLLHSSRLKTRLLGKAQVLWSRSPVLNAESLAHSSLSFASEINSFANVDHVHQIARRDVIT